MTVHERVAAGRTRLRQSAIGAAEANIDARLLAEHVLGWDAARFFMSAGAQEPTGFSRQYEALIARRAAREPLAYIVGRRDFWGLPFEVSPAVLIPRPETELLVEVALELVQDRGRPLVVADPCTGSGCLAVALARELPNARVMASDVSVAALAVAARNAARHAVQGRIQFVRADVLLGIAGPLDLIVANPPYVRLRDRRSLQPEVRDHEPAIALFGGDTGLAVATRLVQQAGTRLRAGGYLLFEFGDGQELEIEQLISRADRLTMVDARRDLQGIPRAAVVRRR